LRIDVSEHTQNNNTNDNINNNLDFNQIADYKRHDDMIDDINNNLHDNHVTTIAMPHPSSAVLAPPQLSSTLLMPTTISEHDDNNNNEHEAGDNSGNDATNEGVDADADEHEKVYCSCSDRDCGIYLDRHHSQRLVERFAQHEANLRRMRVGERQALVGYRHWSSWWSEWM
jgi:hypothetical protein